MLQKNFSAIGFKARNLVKKQFIVNLQLKMSLDNLVAEI